MAGISLILLPLALRFIITPLILYRASRRFLPRRLPPERQWKDDHSRELTFRMYSRIREILLRSESFQVKEDLQSLLYILKPEEEEKKGDSSIRLDFSPVRLLETSLLAYEDLHRETEKRALLRYLLNRKIRWFRPFRKGFRLGRQMKKIPLLQFLNRKGILNQGLRLTLMPLIGLPGLLFYFLRSLILRCLWAGLIRYYYTQFLLKSAGYLIYLYGGNTDELTGRCRKFSHKEIIRKGLHFDRELALVPQGPGMEGELTEMLNRYETIMQEALLTPDPRFSLNEEDPRRRHRLKRRLKDLSRKTLSALNEQFSEKPETPGMKDTALRMILELPRCRYPGSAQPWENFRTSQIVNAGYRLLIIGLGKVYSNAPGGRIAMEKISVDLIRQAREFSRQPLVTLLSRTGKNAYRTVRPLLKLRQLNKVRKTTSPAGVLSLSMPFFGRILQDSWKEFVLYRLGRALIRYTVTEDTSLPDP